MRTRHFRVALVVMVGLIASLLLIGFMRVTSQASHFLVWVFLSLALLTYPILYWFTARVWRAPDDRLGAAKIAVLLLSLISLFTTGQFFDWTAGPPASLDGLGVGVAMLLGPLLFVAFARSLGAELLPAQTWNRRPFQYIRTVVKDGTASVFGATIVAVGLATTIFLGIPEGPTLLAVYVITCALIGLGDLKFVRQRLEGAIEIQRARWAESGFQVGGLIFAAGILLVSLGFLSETVWQGLAAPLQGVGLVLMVLAPLYIAASLCLGAINYDLFGPDFLRNTTVSYGGLTVIGVFTYAGVEELATDAAAAAFGADPGFFVSFVTAGLIALGIAGIHRQLRKSMGGMADTPEDRLSVERPSPNEAD